MSERWSTGSPRTCSGDMYPTVPNTAPASVSGGHRLRLGDLVPLRELREAEVEDLRPIVLREDHVLGLQVAVDDSLLVGGREAFAIWTATSTAFRGDSGPARSLSRSVSPSSSSMTRRWRAVESEEVEPGISSNE